MSIDMYENINSINSPIRKHFDKESKEFYFSVIDVIENLKVSSDPRNYWKVLKNRLNKRDNKLVTECNQLKMKAIDDKYYLTDVAKASTILQIIEVISPSKVAMFEEYFNNVERESFKKDVNFFGNNSPEKNLSTVANDDGEIKVDMYKKDNCIYLTAMLSGVDNENIFISLNTQILTLKFNRQIQNNTDEHYYENKELVWGRFSRIISLPFEVNIDRVETTFNFGLLSIKLFILDKTRIKIVKVN